MLVFRYTSVHYKTIMIEFRETRRENVILTGFNLLPKHFSKR